MNYASFSSIASPLELCTEDTGDVNADDGGVSRKCPDARTGRVHDSCNLIIPHTAATIATMDRTESGMSTASTDILAVLVFIAYIHSYDQTIEFPELALHLCVTTSRVASVDILCI